MRVKLMCGRVGDNFSQNPGQVIDVDEAEARRLIASKQAEPVDGESRTATARPKTRNAKKR